MLTCHGLPRMLTMLNPSDRVAISHGYAFDLASLEGQSQRFDHWIVTIATTPFRGYPGGYVGYQFQMTTVRVRRVITEEDRSVHVVDVIPYQFPINVLGRRISSPRIVVVRFQAVGTVADGISRPRLREG